MVLDKYTKLTLCLALVIILSTVITLVFFPDPVDINLAIEPQNVFRGGSATVYLTIYNKGLEDIEAVIDIQPDPKLNSRLCEKKGTECEEILDRDIFLSKNEKKQKVYILFITNSQIKGRYYLDITFFSKKFQFEKIKKRIFFNVV